MIGFGATTDTLTRTQLIPGKIVTGTVDTPTTTTIVATPAPKAETFADAVKRASLPVRVYAAYKIIRKQVS